MRNVSHSKRSNANPAPSSARWHRAALHSASAGIERPAGEQQPRAHDIRHTFAVRALESCPDGRDRIAQHMIALTTYLGHKHVTDTYWYLQATPRLMRDIADRVREARAHGGGR